MHYPNTKIRDKRFFVVKLPHNFNIDFSNIFEHEVFIVIPNNISENFRRNDIIGCKSH
jgi:hypothetical protein